MHFKRFLLVSAVVGVIALCAVAVTEIRAINNTDTVQVWSIANGQSQGQMVTVQALQNYFNGVYASSSGGCLNYMAVPTNTPSATTFFKYDGTNISWGTPPTNTGPQGEQGPTGATGSSGTNATTTSLANTTNSGLAPSYSVPAIVLLGSSGRSLVTSSVATGFQLSSTCNAHVSYTVQVSTTATIGGASTGSIALQIASSNSTNSTAWTNCASFVNSQTITLAIALNSIQVNTGVVSADIPFGYYVRLLSTGSGTFSNSFQGGCEKVEAQGY